MKKISLLILLSLIVSQVSFGQKSLKVGILFDQFADKRWKIDETALTSKFAEYDVETIVKVSHSDFDVHMKQGFELIDAGVNAIIVISVDGTREHTFFEKAEKKGITIIAYDRPIFDQKVNLFVSYDNLMVGKIQAQYLLDHIEKGNVVLVNGPVTDINAIKFREGQMSVLKPHIESGRINIVHDIVLDSWNEATALLAFFEYTVDLSSIQGLLLAIDSFVDAAIDYSSDASKLENIYVTGQDPSLVAIDRMNSGIQNMSILKPIEPLSQKVVELTMSLLRQEKKPDITPIKINDQYTVNGYLFQPIAVDKNNIQNHSQSLSE